MWCQSRDHLTGLIVCSIVHCDITMGAAIVMDTYCYVTME